MESQNTSNTGSTSNTPKDGDTADTDSRRHAVAPIRPAGERGVASVRDATGGGAQAPGIAFRDSGTEDEALSGVAILGYN